MRNVKLLALSLAMALLVAACGSTSAGDDSGGLATLEETSDATESQSDELTDEEALLGFADCVRDNGVPEFEDPIINADGSIEFLDGPGSGTRGDDGPDGDFRTAIEACGELLESTTFTGGRFGDIDTVELQDQLLLLAACLRDTGLDVDDPDISEGFGGNRDENAEPGTGSGGVRGLFGDNIDLSDPDTQATFESCVEEVNFVGPGGGAGGGAGGGG